MLEAFRRQNRYLNHVTEKAAGLRPLNPATIDMGIQPWTTGCLASVVPPPNKSLSSRPRLRYSSRVKLRLAFLLLLSARLCAPAQQPAAPAYASNPDFQKQRANALTVAHDPNGRMFVADAWMKANKAAGGHCMECFQSAITAAMTTGDYKKAAQIARTMDAAAEQPVYHCVAQIALARALLQQGAGKKTNTAMLEEAHAALTKAEELAPAAYFYDGRALALMQRDPEAAEAFAAYVKKTRTDDPLMVRARHFAVHPELARQQMTPAVVVNTLGGKQFNLDEMNGRVVLIDFWATWCGPCNVELPHMKQLAAKYANEPFELISISWDADEAKWKQFIATNGMTWNQYRDADHAVTNAFGINAIPHYFTIDANGALTAENLGSGSNIDGKIKKLVEQARAMRETVASSTPPATGSH